MGVERQILRALLAQAIEESIAKLISQHAGDIRKLEMKPEEIKTLLWELLDEVVKLHQKIA